MSGKIKGPEGRRRRGVEVLARLLLDGVRLSPKGDLDCDRGTGGDGLEGPALNPVLPLGLGALEDQGLGVLAGAPEELAAALLAAILSEVLGAGRQTGSRTGGSSRVLI
jgi:hypothetical protein